MLSIGSVLFLARLAKWRLLLSFLLLLCLSAALALGPALSTLGPMPEVALALYKVLSSNLALFTTKVLV